MFICIEQLCFARVIDCVESTTAKLVMGIHTTVKQAEELAEAP